MTDLEPRLHHLRDTVVPPGPAADEVRARAGRRRSRRHRRTLLAAVPVTAALVVGAAVIATSGDGSQSVITGNDPTTTGAPATTLGTAPVTTIGPAGEAISIGNVEGLSIEVAPVTDLRDGQLVTVQIEGLDQLSSPVIILCAGDVTERTAARDCDLSPLEPGGSSEGLDRPQASQEVAVRRVIRLPRMADEQDDQGGDFDCATEPVGCALVVGNDALPAMGAGVAVSFADGDPLEGTATVSPARGLTDRQAVQIEASGLRPNSTYAITQCSTTADPVCDEMTWPTAKTDGDGALQAVYPVTAAIYGWRGRADCTAEPCVLQIRSDVGGAEVAVAPIAFDAGVVAPVPHLELSPAGPYDDQQVVTVSGTGFPVGHEIAWELGQCPNGKETSVEERCGYDAIGPNVAVGADGTFTDQIRLHRSGACSDPAGCHLGWVINHGPTLAKVPLEFR